MHAFHAVLCIPAETLTSYQKNFPLHNLAGIFDAIEEAKKEEAEARAAEKEAVKKVLPVDIRPSATRLMLCRTCTCAWSQSQGMIPAIVAAQGAMSCHCWLAATLRASRLSRHYRCA